MTRATMILANGGTPWSIGPLRRQYRIRIQPFDTAIVTAPNDRAMNLAIATGFLRDRFR